MRGLFSSLNSSALVKRSPEVVGNETEDGVGSKLGLPDFPGENRQHAQPDVAQVVSALREQFVAHPREPAEHLFGYGGWDAPFWFIGPEAGMGQDGTDNLVAGNERNSFRISAGSPGDYRDNVRQL